MNNMKKNVLWNAIGTTFNSFNSLFFMIIVTRLNGMSDSGVFTLAFSLACLFCLLAGYEGRVFQVTDTSGEFNDREYILHRYFTSFLAILIVVGYGMIMKYDRFQMLVVFELCLMKILEMLADVYYGILQKNSRLYQVGFSLFIKAILSVLTFFVVDLLTRNLVIACACLDLIWLLILFIYDIPKARKCISKDPVSFKKSMKIFKSGFFAFSILFLSIYLVNAPKYALDGRVDSSLQAVFGIILMPATFLSLAVQYIIQPVLNNLASFFADNQIQKFRKTVQKVVFMIGCIGLPILVVAFFLGIPVLNILYNIDISNYRNELMFILLGAIFYSISTLLSAALTTVRHTFVQFVVFLVSSVFGFVISILLIHSFGITGASIAYLLIMVFQLLLYIGSYFLIMRKLSKECEDRA